MIKAIIGYSKKSYLIKKHTVLIPRMLLLASLALSSTVLAQSASSYDNNYESYQERDPWEGFNRKVFAFNDKFDTYLLKPVAKGYKAITPDVVETGVSNVFSNLLEIRNILNDVLQWKWKQAGNDTGRLLVNTTVGLAGIFDVANKVGLKEGAGEDFGQTLATWGVGEGNFVMLPFFGPSTLRDTAGLPVNALMNPVGYIDHVPTRNSIYAVDVVNKRATLLDTEKLISGDKYSFLRDAYLQRRDYLINDGKVEDDFGDDF